jgi:hypothetical protein
MRDDTSWHALSPTTSLPRPPPPDDPLDQFRFALFTLHFGSSIFLFAWCNTLAPLSSCFFSRPEFEEVRGCLSICAALQQGDKPSWHNQHKNFVPRKGGNHQAKHAGLSVGLAAELDGSTRKPAPWFEGLALPAYLR